MRSDRRLRLGHPIKVTGVSTTGAVGTVSVLVQGGAPSNPPTITGVNRQVASAEGGTPILITGTNFDATTTVKLNGVTCKLIYYTATTVHCLTPALPASPKTSGYDLIVSNGSLSAQLTNAIDVVGTAANVYARGDFDDDTLGTWTQSGSDVTVSTDYAFTGTKSCKMVSSGIDGDCLIHAYGFNPARGPAGILTHWRLLLPQSTINNVNNNGTTGQIKLHLYRNKDNTADPSRKHGIVLAVGPQARGNQLACFFDWNNVPCSGTRIDGTAFTSGDTGLVFVADTWNEILLEQSNDGTTGRARLWLNGRRVVNQTNVNMVGGTAGGALETAEYISRIGIAYTENGVGPLTVYVDDAWTADGVPTGVVLGNGEAPVEFNPATDTLLKQDSLQYTTESSGYFGPSSNWHKLIYPHPGDIAYISGVTASLDPAASTKPGYPIGFKFFLPDSKVAITNGTWPVGTGDYQAGCEGGMFGSTQMGDDAIGGQPSYRFWWSFRRKVSVGFRWSAFDDPVITPNTQRQFNYKQWLVFREAYGGPNGRVTFSTLEESGIEVNGSSATGEFPGWPEVLWEIGVGPDSADPAHGTVRCLQDQNNQLHGVDKSPNSISRDGKEHTFVITMRNESILGLGDGLIGIWVDGYPIGWWDGADPDPSNKVYLRMHTRIRAYKTCQFEPIVNGGAVQDQFSWLLGPSIAWSRP